MFDNLNVKPIMNTPENRYYIVFGNGKPIIYLIEPLNPKLESIWQWLGDTYTEVNKMTEEELEQLYIKIFELKTEVEHEERYNDLLIAFHDGSK